MDIKVFICDRIFFDMVIENKEVEIVSNQPSLKRNVVLNYIYQILIIIIPFITTPYLSRVLLDVEGTGSNIGIFSYTNSLVNFFIIFAALGTSAYGIREISKKRDNKKEYSKLFFEIELVSVITSFISLLLWVVLSSLYTEYRLYLFILSLNIFATCFDISWLYIGLEKFKYTISINSIFRIISLILIFVLIKSPSHLWIYFVISSGSMLFGNLSMWLFLPKVIQREKLDLINIKYHFKNSLKYFIPTIATTIYTVLDKTLIGLLIPGTITPDSNIKIADVESGFYEQAYKILSIVKTLSFMSINGVMYSRVCNLYENNEIEKINTYRDKTFHLTLNLSIGAMFGLIATASLFVPLYFGEGYDKTITLIMIMSVLIPIICISFTLGNIYYSPFGKRKQSSTYLIIGAIINLALNIPLIILLKSIGAAIASIVAELVISILYVLKSNKFFSLKELFLVSWKKILSGGIMFALVYLIRFLFETYLDSSLIISIIEIVTIVIAGVLSYELVLLLLKDKSISITKELISKVFSRNKKTTSVTTNE